MLSDCDMSFWLLSRYPRCMRVRSIMPGFVSLTDA